MNFLLLLGYLLGRVLLGTDVSVHTSVEQEIHTEERFYLSSQSPKSDTRNHSSSSSALLVEESNETELEKKSIFDGFGSSSGLAKLELTTFVYLPLSFLHTAFTSEIAPRSFSRCIFFRNLRI
jgi:hypothetical protein